ncbi:MAG: hypothetical protein ABI761_20125 [Saprospiraceae bacterium]
MSVTSTDDLIPIGVIARGVGYKLAIRVDPYPGFESTWSELKKCLIKTQGILAPYFIKSKTKNSDFLDIIFEDIKEDQDIKDIAHQEIFIHTINRSSRDIPEEEGDVNEWIGFSIKDNKEGDIGLIESIEELPGQILAGLHFQDRMIQIPLAEDLILDIDLENKIILMDLPEGILML